MFNSSDSLHDAVPICLSGYTMIWCMQETCKPARKGIGDGESSIVTDTQRHHSASKSLYEHVPTSLGLRPNESESWYAHMCMATRGDRPALLSCNTSSCYCRVGSCQVSSLSFPNLHTMRWRSACTEQQARAASVQRPQDMGLMPWQALLLLAS